MTEQIDIFEELSDSVFDLDVSAFEGIEDEEFDYSFDTDRDRYVNPGKKGIKSKPVKYRNALQLSKQIGNIKKSDRYFVFLDGTFVFGDFIEAWVMENAWNVLEMTISTLSLSENNIDSIGNLFHGDYLQKFNLIVSDYWYAHERDGLVKYAYHELDKDSRFQLAVARVHSKICLIKTECGKKIIIHGSANLRSSNNVEQIVIEWDNDLFDYNELWHNDILERYKTINKQCIGADLWLQDPEFGKHSIKTGTGRGLQVRQHSQGGRASGKGLTESKTDGKLEGNRETFRSKGKGAW